MRGLKRGRLCEPANLYPGARRRLAAAIEAGAVIRLLVPAGQRHVGYKAHLQVQNSLGGSIAAFLGHLAVGGPLATGAGDEPGRGDVDKVVPDEGLGVLSLRSDWHQRAEAWTTPLRLPAAAVDIRREVVAHFVQDPALDRASPKCLSGREGSYGDGGGKQIHIRVVPLLISDSTCQEEGKTVSARVRRDGPWRM